MLYLQPLERLEILEPGDHRLMPNPSATSTPGIYAFFSTEMAPQLSLFQCRPLLLWIDLKIVVIFIITWIQRQ